MRSVFWGAPEVDLQVSTPYINASHDEHKLLQIAHGLHVAWQVLYWWADDPVYLRVQDEPWRAEKYSAGENATPTGFNYILPTLK